MNKFYSKCVFITKKGLKSALGLDSYLRECVTYRAEHKLLSDIERKMWPSFVYVSPADGSMTKYKIELQDDLAHLDLYKIYPHNEIVELAIMPTTKVINNQTLKATKVLDVIAQENKDKKRSTVQSKTKPKAKGTKRTKSSTRTKRSRKGSKSRQTKSKK